MTLQLVCPDENAPCPKPVWLVLECDGTSCGLICPLSPTFFKEDGYIAQRKAATKAGWLVTGSGKVYGPNCAGPP